MIKEPAGTHVGTKCLGREEEPGTIPRRRRQCKSEVAANTKRVKRESQERRARKFPRRQTRRRRPVQKRKKSARGKREGEREPPRKPTRTANFKKGRHSPRKEGGEFREETSDTRTCEVTNSAKQ